MDWLHSKLVWTWQRFSRVFYWLLFWILVRAWICAQATSRGRPRHRPMLYRRTRWIFMIDSSPKSRSKLELLSNFVQGYNCILIAKRNASRDLWSQLLARLCDRKPVVRPGDLFWIILRWPLAAVTWTFSRVPTFINYCRFCDNLTFTETVATKWTCTVRVCADILHPKRSHIKRLINATNRLGDA